MPTDDDVYVNSGETYQDNTFYPDEPHERQEEEATQAAILAASYPIMADIADWFSEQIEACDSRRSIKAYAETHGLDLEVTSHAFDIVRELLEAKNQDFEQFKRER